jgi:hypothetical protein
MTYIPKSRAETGDLPEHVQKLGAQTRDALNLVRILLAPLEEPGEHLLGGLGRQRADGLRAYLDVGDPVGVSNPGWAALDVLR